MTRPQASRYPVSSFGPELMEILIKGSRERVEIPCPDQKTMKFLQMRIQMLRGAMQRERHPQYALSTRARTSRHFDPKNKDKDCVLVVQPQDAQFKDILAKVGLTPSQNSRDLLDETAAPDTPHDPTIQPASSDTAPPDAAPNPYDRFK